MKRRLSSVALVCAGIGIGLLLAAGWQASGSLAQTNAGCQTFPQTGHTVCDKFLTYWQQHGGLAQNGYPISEPFVETSDLNGKPYTVQYFERAVFEMHPENQPPYDVLLSQLGTYLGRQNYTQGFLPTAGAVPFYEHRDSASGTLKSYYNAINRKEYDRAYTYFQGAPNPDPAVAPPYAQFVAGYSDTVSVTLALGHEVDDAGAGNLFASIPVAIVAKHTDGHSETFGGCYILHRVNDGISPDPRDTLWSIRSAKLTPAPAGATIDSLLAQPCGP
jgi:hypothetical protein